MTPKRRHRAHNPTRKEAAAWREAGKRLAEQALVHRTETTALAVTYVRMKEALGEAVKTIDWIRGAGAGQWTPADSVRLDEWRELAK